jgi:DNA-binding PadR family transcriptional regulator
LLDRGEWRHGYDLSRETELKSGTLYPILIRLEKSGWLEARWEDEPTAGKPRRHLYRLTGSGREQAVALAAASGEATPGGVVLGLANGGVE